MLANIKLTRFASDPKAMPASHREVWPVSILAEGVGIDDHIFVYQVGKTEDPIMGDKFECVASVNQLMEIPKDLGTSLTTVTGIPFYRSNILEYVCRSADEAQRIWEEVVKEVELLVKNWDASKNLKGTDFATITSDQTIANTFDMFPPIRKQISYLPAGIAGVSGDKQIITVADASLDGWLPVSSASPSIRKPPGARFYYNLDRDSALSAVWPPKEPFDGNELLRNGIALPYGVVYVITADTVWWLDFDPATIPGYQRAGWQENDGDAPWPTDFVDRTNPGLVPNMLVLILFK